MRKNHRWGSLLPPYITSRHVQVPYFKACSDVADQKFQV